MLHFAANLTMLFTELPFLQRFAAARQAGFDYVEYLFPYDWPAETLADKLQQNQLRQVLFNLPPGNWSEGERGIAGLPERKEEFRSGIETAIPYAHALGVSQLNCLAGLKQEEHEETLHWQTLTENLRYAAERLARENIQLLVEPINSRIDMPGFLLDSMDKTKKLLKDVGHANLAIQFDFYHMQIMHGDVARLFSTHLHNIKHVQFADNPGRQEPGTGELNYNYLFQHIEASGYQGFVSAEYRPSGSTEHSLSWFNDTR